MERYLTQKSLYTRWWEAPVNIVSGLFTAIGAWVVITDANPAEPMIQVSAAAVFLCLMALPMLFGIRRSLRRKKARAIAKCLSQTKGSSITLGALERRSGVRGAEDAINKLTETGFLKNVDVDAAHGMVRLPEGGTEAPAPDAPVLDTGIEAYNAKLREIREMNERINDPGVSKKIARIEELTGGIFQLVAQQPERANDLRRFINYYLPTTLKLLESYDLMEEQRYQGENITASRRQIEAALDKMIQAIERQQDKLFQYDALDVETDIQVLETMMVSDGLTEQGMKI